MFSLKSFYFSLLIGLMLVSICVGVCSAERAELWVINPHKGYRVTIAVFQQASSV